MSEDPGAVRVALRGWWMVALAVAVCLFAATAYLQLAPKRYEAVAKIVVGQGGRLSNPQAGSPRALTQTMSDLLRSQTVAQRATAVLGLKEPPEDILARVSVSNNPDAAVLSVSYRDRSPDRARRVLTALTNAFVSIVPTRLEEEKRSQRVEATVFDAPYARSEPVGPSIALIYVAALVVGLAIGLLGAGLRAGAGARRTVVA